MGFASVLSRMSSAENIPSIETLVAYASHSITHLHLLDGGTRLDHDVERLSVV